MWFKKTTDLATALRMNVNVFPTFCKISCGQHPVEDVQQTFVQNVVPDFFSYNTSAFDRICTLLRRSCINTFAGSNKARGPHLPSQKPSPNPATLADQDILQGDPAQIFSNKLRGSCKKSPDPRHDDDSQQWSYNNTKFSKHTPAISCVNLSIQISSDDQLATTCINSRNHTMQVFNQMVIVSVGKQALVLN